jgi:RNA polymerase sigma factor (sigma-70 family)
MRGRGAAIEFDAWYGQEWPRLVATLTLAAGDRELGRELAAESFTRALERWTRVGAMESPAGWTYRVGFNLLHRHHRRRTLERRALEHSMHVPSPSIESGCDDEVDLQAAIAALPDRERTVVALRYGADMTEPDIARLLGIASGTVSATLNHARAHLRDLLSLTADEANHG